MNDIIIRCEGLGKSYTIGHQGPQERYTALRDVLARHASGVWNATRRALRGQTAVAGDQVEEFWALKDVSFEIKRGEVVGIIGRNGAGKSTLLKILSRITEPTEGRVTLRGRVASLLEVGTGFHPELTGRENIFLNGAILGMTRSEIKRKFEEIVSFAEVEKFLDTSVKRYSSGMYVRLAFAVAAHLEPEILVVDEVLAVGDVEFQKKCISKMKDVGRTGRTVFFVSHNMAAIKSLTSRSIVLNKGYTVFDGSTVDGINSFIGLGAGSSRTPGSDWGKGQHTAILSARVLDSSRQSTNHYKPGDPLNVNVSFKTDGIAGLSLEVFLLDACGIRIGLLSLYQFHEQSLPRRAGIYSCDLQIAPQWLASGRYSLDITTSIINSRWDHYVESAVDFEVVFSNPNNLPFDFKQSHGYGLLALLCTSDMTLVESSIHGASQAVPALI